MRKETIGATLFEALLDHTKDLTDADEEYDNYESMAVGEVESDDSGEESIDSQGPRSDPSDTEEKVETGLLDEKIYPPEVEEQLVPQTWASSDGILPPRSSPTPKLNAPPSTTRRASLPSRPAPPPPTPSALTLSSDKPKSPVKGRALPTSMLRNQATKEGK